LIVDDNAMNIELVSYMLEAEPMQVESAIDAAQAMRRIQASIPDLILMDIQLPGMDGVELTRRLKADPATRSIVIVALTAYAMKGDEAKMRAAGCDGYIAKPIDVNTFADRIRAIMTCADDGLASPLFRKARDEGSAHR
jgi:CheY-like chemotaxis protein